MDLYQGLVSEEVGATGGTLVNFVGDNFMAAFDEATEAMQAAIAVTEAVADKNAGLPTLRQVRFRMGMDHGDVMVSDDGQYFGDALNIAARIQAMALPGGVSVSGNVYRALGEPALRFRSMGPKSLKNIPEQVQVYQFSDLPADDPQAGRGRLLALESPSVAVLPIHTESLDPSLRPAGALLISDVIHHLAGMPNLNVIDASDEQHPSRADTTVEYMLETGIQQFGEQIRVYAKLVDVATINIVFSHRWEATASSLSSLSDDVAIEVAHLLEIELVVGEPARIYSEIGDPVAQEHIYQGWYQLNTGTQKGWERPTELFEKVAETHPDLPAGYALLAYAHWMGAAERFDSDPKSHFVRARDYAQKGLATGDPTGLSQMVEAAILMSEGKADLALERAESAPHHPTHL
jgi:TolB-like protein